MLSIRVFPLGVTSCEGERAHKRSLQGSFAAANKVLKRCPGKQDKTFIKRSRRCNCKARVIFYIEPNWEWVCKKHEMVHNHELLLEDEVHMLRWHKKIEKAHVDFF